MSTAKLMADITFYSHTPDMPEDIVREAKARTVARMDPDYIRGRRGGMYRIVKVEREGWVEDYAFDSDLVKCAYRRRAYAVYEPPRKRRVAA